MDKSILIVDDESRARYMVDYLQLVAEKALKVDLAQTIEQAIQFLEEHQYDVILCDLLMPPEKFVFKNKEYTFQDEAHFNGGLLIEYCVKRGISKKTKILVSSMARGRSQELVEKFNNEIEMFSKPFRMNELIKKIENAH